MSEISRLRHIFKTITWRVVATTDTILLSWFITGSLDFGLKIGLFEVVTKMFLYYGHERLWYKSNFGVVRETWNKFKTGVVELKDYSKMNPKSKEEKDLEKKKAA